MLPRERNLSGVKNYFKDKFAVAETSTLTTKEMAEFADKVQMFMVEGTRGHYEPLAPEPDDEGYDEWVKSIPVPPFTDINQTEAYNRLQPINLIHDFD